MILQVTLQIFQVRGRMFGILWFSLLRELSLILCMLISIYDCNLNRSPKIDITSLERSEYFELQRVPFSQRIHDHLACIAQHLPYF